jgi:TetR/AcrR family transcriptional repressor of bet genes
MMTTLRERPPLPASPRRAFSKKTPDIRRLELIRATCRCLVRYGASETSVRTIADEAGLSLGMVRHHFNSKDELLAATLQYLSDQIQVQIQQATAAAGDDPRARLKAFVTASLNPDAREPDYVMNRFVFWGLAHRNQAVRAVHDRIYDRFEKQLRQVIEDVASANGVKADCRTLTIVVMALFKGIWVELSLSARRIQTRKMIEHVMILLDHHLRR